MSAIKASEYDAIRARFKALGRTDDTIRQIAEEFGRSEHVISKLASKMRVPVRRAGA